MMRQDAAASSSKKRRKMRRRKKCSGTDAEPRYNKFTPDILIQPWMDAFAAGPDIGDEHEFYRMICKHVVSVGGKGSGELLRRFESASHFPLDQRFRITDDGVVYSKLGSGIETMDPNLHAKMMPRPRSLRA